jgi:hypothetical protein
LRRARSGQTCVQPGVAGNGQLCTDWIAHMERTTSPGFPRDPESTGGGPCSRNDFAYRKGLAVLWLLAPGARKGLSCGFLERTEPAPRRVPRAMTPSTQAGLRAQRGLPVLDSHEILNLQEADHPQRQPGLSKRTGSPVASWSGQIGPRPGAAATACWVRACRSAEVML